MGTKLFALLSFVMVGCGTVALNCPSDHTVTATLNGPNIATIAQQLAAVVGPLVAGGLVSRKESATESTVANDGTLNVKTLDIFGVQQYSCGNASPPVAVKTP